MRLGQVCLLVVLWGCGSEVSTWCDGVSECGSMDKQECLEVEEQEVANAQSWGCEDVYDDYLACRNNTSVCANGVYTPDPIDACAQASLGYNACLADAEPAS